MGFAAAVGLINMILNTKILWFRILLRDLRKILRSWIERWILAEF